MLLLVRLYESRHHNLESPSLSYGRHRGFQAKVLCFRSQRQLSPIAGELPPKAPTMSGLCLILRGIESGKHLFGLGTLQHAAPEDRVANRRDGRISLLHGFSQIGRLLSSFKHQTAVKRRCQVPAVPAPGPQTGAQHASGIALFSRQSKHHWHERAAEDCKPLCRGQDSPARSLRAPVPPRYPWR